MRIISFSSESNQTDVLQRISCLYEWRHAPRATKWRHNSLQQFLRTFGNKFTESGYYFFLTRNNSAPVGRIFLNFSLEILTKIRRRNTLLSKPNQDSRYFTRFFVTMTVSRRLRNKCKKYDISPFYLGKNKDGGRDREAGETVNDTSVIHSKSLVK
jgi:hypothetical protein